jgi:hypothetical protein
MKMDETASAATEQMPSVWQHEAASSHVHHGVESDEKTSRLEFLMSDLEANKLSSLAHERWKQKPQNTNYTNWAHKIM